MLLGVGIDETDISQVLLQLRKLFRGNADAVVLDGNQQPALLYPGAYEQRSLAQRGFYTMKNCIFHQRLKQKFHDGDGQGFRAYAADNLQLSGKTGFLDIQIGLCDFQLLGERDIGVSLNVIAEQSGQGIRHTGDFGHLFLHGDIPDGLQGIIKKMRIDLAAQEFQFRLFLFQLGFIK